MDNTVTPTSISPTYDKLYAENASHDPHGFKAQGENSAKHAFVDTPYVHQLFPTTIYRDAPVETKTVANADDLKAALADGWRETPKVAEVTAPPIQAYRNIQADRNSGILPAGWKPAAPHASGLHPGGPGQEVRWTAEYQREEKPALHTGPGNWTGKKA
jgi:hypothetical protein